MRFDIDFVGTPSIACASTGAQGGAERDGDIEVAEAYPLAVRPPAASREQRRIGEGAAAGHAPASLLSPVHKAPLPPSMPSSASVASRWSPRLFHAAD